MNSSVWCFRRRALRWVPLVGLCATLFAQRAAAETLSAEQAVSRAAQGNPSLRAALLDERAARHAVAAERGARAPNLVVSVQGEHAESVSRAGDSLEQAQNASAGARSLNDALSSRAAVTYSTDIGTRLELGTSGGVAWQRRSWSGLNPLPESLSVGPTYSADAYLSARQPLLRGAGSDVELAPLHQAESAARGAASRQLVTASQTARDVLKAYWSLWYAERALAVQEQAESVAARLVTDAQLRAERIGTGSRLDVLQFSTSAASIADALSRARAERTNRAIELGRLLGVAPAVAQALSAREQPPEQLGVLELDQQDLALTSPALAALRADLERAHSRVVLARDADQPRVDLFARASVGTLWDDGDFSLSGGQPAYGVLGGVEIELPLGAGRSGADRAAAQSELEAAEARYRSEELALRAQVTSLGVSLKAAAEQVQLSTQTASAAGELAAAERQRLDLGTGTAQDVVLAEQTSREAELRRLQALSNQVSARFELEHATGKLLERFAAL